MYFFVFIVENKLTYLLTYLPKFAKIIWTSSLSVPSNKFVIDHDVQCRNLVS